VTWTRATKLAAFLAVALATAAPARAQRLLLSGNNDGLWLVRLSEDGRSFDVTVKPAHVDWKWATPSALGGRPVAAVAVGQGLHVLFEKPAGYLRLDMEGGTTPLASGMDARWPADAAAMGACEAGEFVTGAAPSLLAAVPRQPAGLPAPISPPPPKASAKNATRPARTATRPAPSTAPRHLPAGRVVQIGIFQNLSGEWTHLADLPPLAVLPGANAFLTALKGELFVLLPGGHAAPNRLFTVTSSGAVHELALEGFVAGATPLAMTRLQGRLAILLATPAPRNEAIALHLATFDADKRTFAARPLLRNGNSFELPGDSWPAGAAYKGKFTIVWRQEGQYHSASADLNGQVSAGETLSIFQRFPLGTGGQEAYQAFNWILLGAILAAMFALRRKGQSGLFLVPPYVRLAPLGKRLGAAMIDFLPFLVLMSAIFYAQVGSMTEQQMIDMIKAAPRQKDFPASLAYSVIAATVLYGLYCFLMELRFRATLGKLIFRLRVAGDQGLPADVRGVVLRNLVRVLEVSWLLMMPILVPLLILVTVMNRNRQRLGDMMARTVVIDVSRGFPVPPPPEPTDETTDTEE